MIETNIHWFSFELLSLSSPMIVETILYVPAGKIVENYIFFLEKTTLFLSFSIDEQKKIGRFSMLCSMRS